MSPRSTPTVALAASLGLLAGCAEDVTPPPLSFSSLAFDTAFVLGTDASGASIAFEGVWDIEVGPSGRLAVLDIGPPAVHIYDPEGEHVASIDASGLDEGQLDRPSGIVWSRPGELRVWDPGSSWVSRFEVSANEAVFVDRYRAFAFGETGFCVRNDRAFLSYFGEGQVVHEIGETGITNSFGAAPAIDGGDSLGAELLDIATEELTPSALLCTDHGIVDVSFVQRPARLHSFDGEVQWAKDLEGVRPIAAYSDDFIGLGRAFDEGEGSHLLRALVPWGEDHILVQHELRRSEYPEPGDPELFESRIIALADGSEVDRTRDLPLLLAAGHGRLYFVEQRPVPTITVVQLH